MHQISAAGAYSAPPDPLAGFRGSAAKGKKEMGKKMGEGMGRIGPKGKERNWGGMGMKGARVTDRLQFPLSRVSRCNIYCRAVLQLDMKHCGFYSFFARRCVLSIN